MICQKVLPLSLLLVGVWGGCMTPQKAFDVKRFMGQWTLYSFLSPEGAEPPLRCLRVDFEPKGDNRFHANLTGILLADGNFYSDDGPMTLDNPTEPGRINIQWRGEKYFMTVVESDYDTYAAVNGCAEDEGGHVVKYCAIMCRGSSLPDDTVQRLQKVLADVGTDVSGLVKIDQSNCP